MKKLFSIVILLAFALTSCNSFNGKQDVPAYINFKGFYLVENPDFTFSQSEDLLTSDIRDVWVYIDNIFLGAFPLNPNDSTFECVIPILQEGKHKIDLRPGIIYNGINSMREEEVFYTTYVDSVDLVPGQEITIPKQPIMYNSERCSMPFKETFESYFINFQQADVIGEEPLSMATISGDSVAYGNHCGAIYFENNGHNKYITIDSIFCNNDNGIILEIDYNSNVPFEIGMYGRSSSAEAYKYISAVRLTPPQKGGWQKIYVLLSKVWNTLGYPTNFKIYLEAFNPDNVSNPFIHVDNIKFTQYPNQ